MENGKPAPDVFLLAAKRLGVDPKDCLILEDSKAGIKAGKASRCDGIYGSGYVYCR